MIEMLELIDPADKVIFDGFRERNVVRNDDQIHESNNAPCQKKFHLKFYRGRKKIRKTGKCETLFPRNVSSRRSAKYDSLGQRQFAGVINRDRLSAHIGLP